GHLVTWHVTPVGPWSMRVHGAVGTLGESERDLRTALLLATRALDDLDVARWRDDAAGAIADLRAGGAPTWQLPALVALCATHRPAHAGIGDEAALPALRDGLREYGCATRAHAGDAALAALVAGDDCDTVVAAIVGAAGLESTLAAAR